MFWEVILRDWRLLIILILGILMMILGGGDKVARKARRKVREIVQVKPSKRGGLGLPELLKAMRGEKAIATIACKVQPSLKKWISDRGGSSWLREAILLKLKEEGS